MPKVSGARTSQAPDFEHDPRYQVAQREALLSVGYWVIYTAGTVIIAWTLGHRDPTEVGFILGFPDWFFWSIIAFAGFMALVVPYLMVKFGFTDIDLEPTPKSGATEEGQL